MSTANSPREPLDHIPLATARPQPHGWWRRNGLWFVPTLLLAVIVLGGAAGYWALPSHLQPGSLPDGNADHRSRYAIAGSAGRADRNRQVAVAEHCASARVEERETDVRWHIQGPKGRAERHVHARFMQGKWEIDQLEVNGKRVTVIGQRDSEAEAPQFTGSDSASQKPDAHTPPPEINLPVPPTDGPEK